MSSFISPAALILKVRHKISSGFTRFSFRICRNLRATVKVVPVPAMAKRILFRSGSWITACWSHSEFFHRDSPSWFQLLPGWTALLTSYHRFFNHASNISSNTESYWVTHEHSLLHVCRHKYSLYGHLQMTTHHLQVLGYCYITATMTKDNIKKIDRRKWNSFLGKKRFWFRFHTFSYLFDLLFRS